MRLIAACAALLILGGSASAVRAADAEHWLTPSRHHLERATLFPSGVPGGAAPVASGATPAPAGDGAVLYGVHCAACHGADLKGSPGAPSLQQAGGAAVDFYLTTGRMPLADRAAVSPAASPDTAQIITAGTQPFHQAPMFDSRQIAALEAYVNANVAQTLPIPNVRLDSAKMQRGRKIFENDCEACHGAAAEGATAGYQWTAPALRPSTPTQIGEAIRIGPGVMPRFTAAQLSDDDVSAVATYVQYLASEPQTYGGTVMEYLGPTAEGVVGGIIGVGFLFWVVYFTGTKADGRRVHERD